MDHLKIGRRVCESGSFVLIDFENVHTGYPERKSYLFACNNNNNN
jgi:hypothetical protein